MKRRFLILGCVLMMAISFAGCGKNSSSTSSANNEARTDVDVDLTELSSTMVYSEVFNMMNAPSDYIGKTVRMNGKFIVYVSENGDTYYPSVIIADATACCSQGLEFMLKDNPQYPDGYPTPDKEITVSGVFETYQEDGKYYCRLNDAQLE